MGVYLEEIILTLLLKKVVDKESFKKEYGLVEEEYIQVLDEITHRFSHLINVGIDEKQVCISVKNKAELFKKLSGPKQLDFNDSATRIAYLFKQLLLKDGYLNISDLAEELLVSRGTVNNDIKKAKKILKKYGATIHGIPNKGIVLEGDEFAFRLIFIYEVYDQLSFTYLLPLEIFEVFQKIVEYYQLDIKRKHLFYKTIVISLMREDAENKLEQPIPMYINVERQNDLLNELFSLLKNEYSLQLNRNNKNFMVFPINTRNSSFALVEKDPINEDLLRGIVHEIVQQIKWNYMIDIDEKLFYNKIKHHLFSLLNRLIFRLPNDEILSTKVKQHYPLAYELARISMKVLKGHYKLQPTEVDINYFSIYFALLLNEKGEVNYNDEPPSIAIITNKGRGVFELIKREILRIVGKNARIDHRSTIDMQNKALNSYTIVFSTETLVYPTDVPVVKLDSFVDTDQEISQSLYQVVSQSSVFKDGYQNFIELENTTFDYQLSYREIVDYLIQEYQKDEKVSPELYQYFVKKDNSHSMIYENGVAFPHLIDPYANKLLLSIAVPDESKTLDDLELVFFLIVPSVITSKQEQLLTEIYDRVFKAIGDKTCKEEMKIVQTLEDFFRK